MACFALHFVGARFGGKVVRWNAFVIIASMMECFWLYEWMGGSMNECLDESQNYKL